MSQHIIYSATSYDDYDSIDRTELRKTVDEHTLLETEVKFAINLDSAGDRRLAQW